jgi:septal ring factor EnvC (AmiA/AmiB activator)
VVCSDFSGVFSPSLTSRRTDEAMTRTWTIVLLLLLAFGMCLADDTSRPRETTRQDYERITREIETKREKHRGLRKKERSLLEDLDRLAFALNRRSKELKSLEREQSQTVKAIDQKEREVQNLHDQMAVTREHMENRLAGLYKMSRIGPWVFLLSAESYTDFLRMFRFFCAMIDHDVDLLTTFEDQLHQEESLQRELETYHSDLKQKEAKLLQKKREIETLKGQEKKTLKKVRKEKAAFAKVIDDLEKQAERLQSMIQTLPSRGGEGSFQGGAGFQTLKGRLPLPVEGKLETKEGERLRGISLKASPGAIVHGVFKGRVVYADWFKGYGNLMIVDHGDNFHTVMAHLSEMLKKRDDWVETGEPIAQVGDTGSLGGSVLYFEIRHRGVPLNPVAWFSQKDRLAIR